MKKLIAIISVIALVASIITISACGGNKQNTESESNTYTPSTIAPVEPTPVTNNSLANTIFTNIQSFSEDNTCVRYETDVGKVTALMDTKGALEVGDERKRYV